MFLLLLAVLIIRYIVISREGNILFRKRIVIYLCASFSNIPSDQSTIAVKCLGKPTNPLVIVITYRPEERERE